MDSKEDILNDITGVVKALSQKVENLQQKIEDLCKSTGKCKNIKIAHKELIPENKSKLNETNINPLREIE